MRVYARLLVLVALLTAGACTHEPSLTGTPLGVPAPDFTLTDQHGAPWSLSQQRGKIVALFFGYTHCEDTCPATLAKIADAIAKSGAADAEIAFVTVDPERDTPPVMGAYVERFAGATIVGLTGTQAQIQSVEHAYHVWAQKIPGKTGGENYDDAHSSFTYLIGRDGKEAALHQDDDSPAAFAADLRALSQ
jgi:protein SCO1/2